MPQYVVHTYLISWRPVSRPKMATEHPRVVTEQSVGGIGGEKGRGLVVNIWEARTGWWVKTTT